MSSTTVETNTVPVFEQKEGVESRRRYWVQPGLQARVIGWLVLISAIASTAGAWIVLLVVWSPLASHIAWTNSGADADWLFRDTCMRVFLTTGLLVLVFGLIAFVTGLLLSHRVAGPLHRIARIAGGVANGVPAAKVTVRRGDYVHEFASQFNAMLDYLDERTRRHEEALDSLHAKLCSLQSLADDKFAPPAIQKELDLAARKVDETRSNP